MHSSKKWFKAVLFLVLVIAAGKILEFALVPTGYARLDLHNIRENEYDDIYVGTSHGFAGISPEVVDQVTGRKSTNLCLPNEFPIDSYYLVKEASRHHKPKRVIYELDPGYWVVDVNKGKEEVFIYNEFPPSFLKLQYAAEKFGTEDFRYTLFPWYPYRQQLSQIPSNLKLKLSEQYKSYDPAVTYSDVQYYKSEGFLYHNRVEESKGDLNIVLWDKDKIKDDRREYFEKMAAFCKKEGIELIAVTLPVPQETLDAYPDVYKGAHEYYTELLDEHGITYYDFNYIEDEGIDRSMDNYYDYDGHMYGDYAEKFGLVLGKYLK